VLLVALVAEVAEVALVAVAALPDIEIPHVPVAFVPSVFGAPIVLYDIVLAVDPLNDVPDASPAPPLLNVTALVTEPALVADDAFDAFVAQEAVVLRVLVAALSVNPVKLDGCVYPDAFTPMILHVPVLVDPM